MLAYLVSPKAKLSLDRAIERGGPMPVLHRDISVDQHQPHLQNLYLSIPGEQVASDEWTQLVWLSF